MTNDPIVEEVRKIRQELFEKCGYDLHRFMQFLRESEKPHDGPVIRSLEELQAHRKSMAAVDDEVSAAAPNVA